MILEKILEGGISTIFGSNSQVVPYDKFTKNPKNDIKLEKNELLTTSPHIFIFLMNYLGGKDVCKKFSDLVLYAQVVFLPFVVDFSSTPLYP